jgi:ribosomal protein L16 Arg81 hydroxylase
MSSIANLKTADKTKLYCQPFQMKHGLQGHKLFQLPRLIELARSMPGDRIEYNSGDVPPGVKPEDVPGIEMGVDEVIAQIENCHAWMVIKNVEHEPQYRALLETFVGDLSSASGLSRDQFSDLQGFVFVSSAHSTTPFHFDAEENVLVQIRGKKFVHMFDNEDRSLVPEEALEIAPSKHRNQHYEDAYEARAQVFALNAGDGVHIPYTHPHWVRTGEQYCISMAMTWKTPEVVRLNKVRLMNGTLRRFGLPQSAPGVRPVADAAKVFAHDAARSIFDPLRKSETMRNALRGLIYGRKANYYLKDTKKA